MSLGPERVTECEKAEERANERARRKAEVPYTASALPKKKLMTTKAISLEIEERQK